jgi:hypothetical protein
MRPRSKFRYPPNSRPATTSVKLRIPPVLRGFLQLSEDSSSRYGVPPQKSSFRMAGYEFTSFIHYPKTSPLLARHVGDVPCIPRTQTPLSSRCHPHSYRRRLNSPLLSLVSLYHTLRYPFSLSGFSDQPLSGFARYMASSIPTLTPTLDLTQSWS